MSESILTSTKKSLGIEADYTAFDPDILMHINSVFSTLCQLGIGPAQGFMIQDATAVWADFLDDDRLNAVKTYMYLRVRLLFDTPTTSFAIAAFQKQIEELEWRLNVTREETYWVDPNPDDIITEEDVVCYDGGSPSSTSPNEQFVDGGTP